MTPRRRGGELTGADELWLGRCDPSVLLAVVVAVPLALVPVFDPGRLVVLWALAVLGALTVAGLTPARLLAAQLPFLGFGVGVLVVNSLTRAGDVLAALGPLVVTDVGLRTGVALLLRTLVVGVVGAAFLAVTDPVRLLGSLQQVARLPVTVGCALLAAYRLLEDLPQEWSTLRRAAQVREPAGAGEVRTPAALGRAAFALLASSIRRAERVALSLESRGLGALDRRRRTVWVVACVGGRDAVLVTAVAAVTAGVLYAPAW